MKRLEHVRYCLMNREIQRQLKAEYEKLRKCVLEKEAAGEDSAPALKWFSFYGRKLAQAERVRLMIVGAQ